MMLLACLLALILLLCGLCLVWAAVSAAALWMDAVDPAGAKDGTL